jgi:hypothetical protein
LPELKAGAVIARIEDRVAKIITHVQDEDDESAHVEEKQAWRDALLFLEAEAPEPWRSVAEAALQTIDITFHRWFA